MVNKVMVTLPMASTSLSSSSSYLSQSQQITKTGKMASVLFFPTSTSALVLTLLTLTRYWLATKHTYSMHLNTKVLLRDAILCNIFY